MFRRMLPVFSLIVLLTACAGAASPAPTAAPAATVVLAPTVVPAAARLVVMTHDSFSVSEAVLKQFTDQTGATVEFLKAGKI